MFEFLRPVQADGRTGTADAMRTFVAQNKRRGVAILISDLYDPEGFEGGINTLRYNKFEPYVIQVFDPSRCDRRSTATCAWSTTRRARCAR